MRSFKITGLKEGLREDGERKGTIRVIGDQGPPGWGNSRTHLFRYFFIYYAGGHCLGNDLHPHEEDKQSY